MGNARESRIGLCADWQAILATCERIRAGTLSLPRGRLGRSPAELAAAGKSAPWKLALAAGLKAGTQS